MKKFIQDSKNRVKLSVNMLICVFLVASLIVIGGCAKFSDTANQIKGSLVGQAFTMNFYDDFGNNALSLKGSKINIGAVTNKTKDQEGYIIEAMTSVLDITINGSQVLQVGNTMVCLEDGLAMIKGADIPSSVEAKSGGSLIPFDRSVNKIKNVLGSKKTVVISSQQGIPIGVLQGDSVYATIPDDLPKMTRLSIDGKSVYIHRANYVILDTDLIK